MNAVAVAVSGGRDSTALLHATAHAAAGLGVVVHALHVHHGLQPEADDWLAHLRAQCRRWAARGLPLHFHARRLAGTPGAGDSVEAWARNGRYIALAEMARAAGCSLVLLAHHRRDQAETLLLQALRGGGPAGLAAMPGSALRGGITWARPWLGQPRDHIDSYLRRHRLRHVDDPSNHDPRHARNRLRSALWPALLAAFPDAEAGLQAAALRSAEAAACLAELAAADMRTAVVGGALQTDAWLCLSAARRGNLLRCWLGGPESLVQRLLLELPRLRSGRWPVPNGELRLHAGQLCRAAMAAPAPAREPAGQPLALDLSQPGQHRLAGWGGSLLVEPVASGGLSSSRLRRALLRPREGAEQFQLGPRSMARSLKKQYQALGVAPWDRGGPLVFDGATLLFVPGLGVDARCVAAAGETQLGLRWLPSEPG